jgi:hypothetical protein
MNQSTKLGRLKSASKLEGVGRDAAVLRVSRPQTAVDRTTRLTAEDLNERMQARRLRYAGGQDAPQTAGRMPALLSGYLVSAEEMGLATAGREFLPPKYSHTLKNCWRRRASPLLGGLATLHWRKEAESVPLAGPRRRG